MPESNKRKSIAVALLLGALFLLVWRGRERPSLDGPAVVREIQQIHELGTVKYSVQKVVGLTEQKVPFGSESLLLVVQGTVVGGVDLSALNASDVIIDKGKVIAVRLPPAKILHAYIDDKQTKVWDRHITWWTPWVATNPDLERQARLQALQSIEQTAREMGILPDAERNAQATIRNLLRAFGVEQVTFRPLS